MPAAEELVLLLPPSEGKAPGGQRGRQAATFARRLGPARGDVRHALGELLEHGGDVAIARALGVRGELLDRATAATATLVRGRPPVLPAWQRYTGVVWEHLDPGSLSSFERDRILIPSGIDGLTTAEDLVADYRLKLSASLGPLGRLGAFWRTPVTRAIASVGRGPIVDLLPAEHLDAVDMAWLRQRRHVISVRFLAPGGRGAAGHAAKAVKGRMAGAILRHGLGVVDDLALDGWRVRHVDDAIEVVAPS